MSKIINTSDLQKKISQVVHDVENNPYIVVNRGDAKMVCLPYFDNCDETIQDYFEDFIMEVNRERLANRYKKSAKSGLSDLKV